MKLTRLFFCVLLSSVVVTTGSAQQNELGWTMESALRQIDRQGSDVETVLAEVEFSWSGDAAGLDKIKTGRIYFNGDGDFRIAGQTPNKRVLLLEGRTLHIYDPAKSQVEEINMSREKGRIESFLSLGISVTGRDLEDDFLVTFVGEQEIGDRRVIGLELTPKKDDMRALVSKIEIWFDQASWLPVRQTISHTSGTQTLTVNYSGIARNLSLNPELFRDDWPRGTEKVRN
jgi:outer membrane lipoprotein-sorting protein